MSKEATARSAISTERAMKLALEALERMKRYGNTFGYRSHEQNPYEQVCEAITALREALTSVPDWASEAKEQPAQSDNTCNNALRIQGKAYPRTCKKCGLGPCVELAQQALDKKAENARELGLDYEPVWNNLPSNKDVEDAMRLKRLSRLAEQPAPATELREQEPVAWMTKTGSVWKTKADETDQPLYTSPPAQQEPVAWYRDEDGIRIYYESKVWDDATPLYTSPPTLSLAQRQARSADTWDDATTWRGLTDDEIYSVLENLQVMHHRPPTTDSRVIFAQAIEAKLRSKNEDRN